ncbi:MAG TPA: hypothetical protein VGI85_13285 [Chthoniobacterales bacterium]
MSDEAKSKFEVPWGTLLPVLAALAGIVAQFKPLVSTRPPAPAGKPLPVVALEDVDARLWQDPIAVAQKEKAALFAGMSAGTVPKDSARAHDISTLVELLRQRAKSGRGKTLLLGVMIDAGPYSEQAETRLRSRQAVLEGLNESGFVPTDGEHIGYVTVGPWPLLAGPLPPGVDSADDNRLLIPWEECAVDNHEGVGARPAASVIVLWLPATNFNPEPLGNLANLINALTNGLRAQVDVKILGPADSTGLQDMVQEASATAWQSAPHRDALAGATIISARATASDDALLYDPLRSPAAGPVPNTVQNLLETTTPKLHFVRAIATDKAVLDELIAELKLRGVPVEPDPHRSQAGRSATAHVVLLSEWDTPYGRSLGTTFNAEANHEGIDTVIARRAGANPPPGGWAGRRIHTYRYLRGIDGQLPGAAAQEKQAKTSEQPTGPDAVAIESTEGLNQADYLRRLARVLQENERDWRMRDGAGIGAIGLLGSDIYDKLMILRALRPEFPAAIFFTNNYDAHFERRDDLDDTHNLIIGSPFGNALPADLHRQNIAPFRDSDQTALYAGTLVATGRMKESVATAMARQPRIFEISRRGAYELSDPWKLGKASRSPKEKGFLAWLHSDGMEWRLLILALALGLVIAWVSVSNAHRNLPRGGTTPERLARVVSSTPFWVICGTPIIILAVAAFAQRGDATLEPFAFFSGISIWPSEMIRLLALVLAIHFMVKAGADMRANAREIEQRYCLETPPRAPFTWTDIGLGFELWRTKPEQRPDADEPFTAQQAWTAYQRRNQFWPRFIRVGILFTLYLIFSVALSSLFPQTGTPARGETAFRFDHAVLIPSVLALLILSFYVVDAIQLNSNFIRIFAREVTRWGHGVDERSRRDPPLSNEELSAYHEIFFIAQRTQVVARLIWYPLIVLTLMIVARWSFFDNWSWPPNLLLIFALNAAWALGSALYLRRAAEELRAAALDNLALLRLGAFTNEVKRKTFEELIEEIRGLKKGAFAPLSEQPFIRAILVPSGGLGLLAVGQRLLDFLQ